MYNILKWLDHVVNPNNTFTVRQNDDGSITLTPKGEVLQQGTNMSATNFNNMEFGILDADIASRILIMAVRDNTDNLNLTKEALLKIFNEYAVETQNITLTGTGGNYPFCGAETSIALKTPRKTTRYNVVISVSGATGCLGEFKIFDKTLNGFKVKFVGTAKAANLDLSIYGGIIE